MSVVVFVGTIVLSYVVDTLFVGAVVVVVADLVGLRSLFTRLLIGSVLVIVLNVYALPAVGELDAVIQLRNDQLAELLGGHTIELYPYLLPGWVDVAIWVVEAAGGVAIGTAVLRLRRRESGTDVCAG